MSDPKRILIVGGVAGGASAAARARRLSETAEIILFERGPDISFANCGLPYHVGGVIPERDRLLVQTPESMERRFRIDVRVNTEVLTIDPAKREITARDRQAGHIYRESYDALILSPGAEPVRPPLPGIADSRILTLRNLADMDAIIAAAAVAGNQRAVVVGGGYIGLEMAEAFRERGMEVTLVELSNQVMGPVDPEMAVPLHQELLLHGVDLRLGASVTSFVPGSDTLEVHLSTGEAIRCGLVLLAIGVRPEVRLAREAGLAIGTTGGIAVDAQMRTSDPDIYAVGDAVEVRNRIGDQPALIPLAGPANRQGRIAADAIFGRSSQYHQTQGTAICKVFSLAIAMTGLSEKALLKAGIPFEKVYVHPASHATYYPDVQPVSLKLLFAPDTGRILGAQAVGSVGADKRIDVLAMALRAGLSVYDLEEAELCYAPPYGSAKDVVNYAGFVAANFLRGDAGICHAREALSPSDSQFLLDVRTPEEVAAGAIPGASNIPVDDLRKRSSELPRDKELLIYCQVGLRGYLACRILTQQGFHCRNLSGGYKTFVMVRNALSGSLQPAPPAPREMHDDTGEADGAGELSGSGSTGSLPRGADGTDRPDALVVDARGLQCPGPIQRLKVGVDSIAVGQTLAIVVTDPAFPSDLPAWCETTGHALLSIQPEPGGGSRARIQKRAPAPAASFASPAAAKALTIVVFSGDLDKVLAAFVIANGAAAMGMQATLFFTFWGINALRRDNPPPLQKTFIERMFGWMMPRGARKLALSKMHMAGVGRALIQDIMRRKRVASLPELIDSAREAGVRMIVCNMSMDLMGIRREELIDGVEEGGVARFLNAANAGNVSLFI